MMQQVGKLRYCSMRQRARKVKLIIDWGHMAGECNLWDWKRVANAPSAWRQTHWNTLPLIVYTRRRCISGKHGSMVPRPSYRTRADEGTTRQGGWMTRARKYSRSFAISMCDIHTSNLSGADYGRNLCGIISKIGYTAPPQAGGGPKISTGNS